MYDSELNEMKKKVDVILAPRTKEYQLGYQQGVADERPKAFAKGYDSGYQKGKEDALDHCEKCETEQWDALYKAEMKGREKGIDAFFKVLNRDNLIRNENDLIIASMLAEQLKEQVK